MDTGVVRRPPFGSNPRVGERGSDTQRRILDAALDVFGAVGFAEARVERITERAGCSRPAFYQYFSSKDDVFWSLADQLGTEMVALTERLDRVTPDAEGVARLTRWIGELLALQEAWAPLFTSFQSASHDDEPRARRARGVLDRTGLAVLRAFGVAEDAANRRLVSTLVATLLRCPFHAEQAPGALRLEPLVDGVARLFHRTFAGPIDGVNVPRRRPRRRRRIAVSAPASAGGDRPVPTRGEQTRLRLLEAGAAVLLARGYHDARVDDIADAAGVSHGTFYRYFDNTDACFGVLARAASARLIDLIDRLHLDGDVDDLRAWLRHWFHTYAADGGVMGAWEEMQTNDTLGALATQTAASVRTRLVRILERRGFGDPDVDATILVALLERGPYSVYTLRFTAEAEAVESLVTAIRRGILALPEPLTPPDR